MSQKTLCTQEGSKQFRRATADAADEIEKLWDYVHELRRLNAEMLTALKGIRECEDLHTALVIAREALLRADGRSQGGAA